MDTNALLTVIGGAIVVVSAVASTVAFFRATLAKTTIEGLRGDRDDLTVRVERLEDERDQLQVEKGVLVTEVHSLRSEVETLRTLKDSTTAVERLAASLVATDRAQALQHHDMLALIQTIPTVLTASHQEVLEVVRSTCHSHT